MSEPHTYRPSRVEKLATSIKLGDYVYTEPCSLPYGAKGWYDARRGLAPRFAELRAALAERGIALKYESSYHWLALAVGSDRRTA